MAEHPTAMRALLATDGSDCAQVAIELAAAIEWPSGSSLRVVTVVEPAHAVLSSSWGPAVAQDLEGQLAETLEAARSAVDAAAERLSRPGVVIEAAVLEGRPASCITDEAETFAAELIIVGSRGHGTISTMVLGSTSAEVVDHAPCPVLIARRTDLGRLILAADGSSCARAAESILAAWQIFGRSSIEAVSVADIGLPWASGLALSAAPEAGGTYGDSVRTLIDDQRHVADEAADRLSDAGRRATARVLEGDPASELVRAAREDGVDAIVIGTHGRTGLSRLLLGSVARNVMLHAPCSVLVARETRSLT